MSAGNSFTEDEIREVMESHYPAVDYDVGIMCSAHDDRDSGYLDHFIDKLKEHHRGK